MILHTALCHTLQIPRLLRIVKVLRLLKLLRMARLAKLPHLMSKLEWLLNRPMAQLSLMCAGVCMLLHWIACAWYYIAVVIDDPNNWVAHSGMVSNGQVSTAAIARKCSLLQL